MSGFSLFLKEHIAAHGPVDVGQFMEGALGHPEHGYYLKKNPFGAAGDFTTAPEISQMFGEMMGAWAADAWMQMGRPDPFMLLECGPGRGTLMADMMRATGNIEGFHSACRIHLLETSRRLRAVQAEILRGYMPSWHDSVAAVPDMPMIVLANEFLDALPVRQLGKTDREWRERVISVSAGEFKFDTKPADADILAFIPGQLREMRGIIEVSPARLKFVKNLCALLRKNTGAALLIDYGHAVSAPGDTLQAVRNHRYAPVLENIGESDLTAHVDFGVLKEAAEKEGVRVSGPAEQGAFLERLGIELRARKLSEPANDGQRKDIENALRRLTHPDEMGTLFKVMGLSYAEDIMSAGF